MSTHSSSTSSSEDCFEIITRELPPKIPLLLESQGLFAENLTLIGSGAHNIVYSFRGTCAEIPDEKNFVIRVHERPSREVTEHDMMNQAATLRAVGPLLKHVARFVHMDCTNDNMLQRPYMITTYLDGEPWDDVTEQEMSFEDEFQICRAIADEVLKFNDIHFSSTGMLEADPENPWKVRPGQFRHAMKLVPLPETPGTRLKDWLAILVDWRASLACESYVDILMIPELHRMIREMDEMNYFTDSDVLNRAILNHSDLHGGNILMAKAEDGKWRVTGLLDWDEACAVPSVLSSSRSLEWMWAGELFDDDELALVWTGNLDFVSDAKLATLSPDRLQLKQAVDEYMASKDSSYMEHVYGRGRWIRRVAKFAIQGWLESRDFKMIEWLIKEWNTHRAGKMGSLTFSDMAKPSGETQITETSTKCEESQGG